MFSDSPVLDPALDKFNRLPFSRRIAEVISLRQDKSSLVIGIYGAWGEGKTTVFNFIELELKKNPDIICVCFNPWFFRDEEKLFLSFFKTLADALNRKLTKKVEDIGTWLEKLAGIFSSVSFADPSGTMRASTQGIEKLGNFLSQVELEENKKRIETILNDENKRVVIFIDDIDRLDKSEINSIFKLVKLSASFRNTIYLLAFDEKKVAASISEKYDVNNTNLGENFLEKIIQVPLRLPPVSRRSLEKFCFECVYKALQDSGLELTDEKKRRFVKFFSEGLAIQVKTPRIAKRYSNSISFSVPLLKDEINIVDLLLIEGIKIFYPKLYNFIQEKPDYFLGTIIDQNKNFQEIKQLINYVLEESLSDFSDESQLCAKSLLKELFPRLKGILENIHYSSDWQTKWTQEKRIASLRYFKRYFIYGIPEDDISDQTFITFLSKLEQNSVSEISEKIKEITNYKSSGIDMFISEIFRNIDQLSPSASKNLALALAQIGDYFPTLESFHYFYSPFIRVCTLTSSLIKKIDVSDSQFECCKKILQNAEPIFLAMECFELFRKIKKDENDNGENLFSDSATKEFAEIIVNRIRTIAQETIIYISFSNNGRRLLSFWSHWSSKEETNSYLQKTFEENSSNSIEFLKSYIPIWWLLEIESSSHISLPSQGDIDRNTYDSIASVVDPQLLIEYLKKVYGEKLDSLDFYHQNDKQTLEEIAACQFVYIHQQVSMDDSFSL